MTRQVSHAADGEDVVLHRALGDLDVVVYADVGAGHPGLGSLSTSLHALGWLGIHVEPVASYAAELRDARPKDVVVEAAAGAASATVPFWVVHDSGLSTTSKAEADAAAAQGWVVDESTIGVLRLADVLDEHLEDRVLHALRLDVGAALGDVLAGAELERHRPWLVVVRTARPGTDEPWEGTLVKAGYSRALFDGVNQWYTSPDHPELRPALSHPACSLDPWVRVGGAYPDPPTGEPAQLLSATALQLAVARAAQSSAEARATELATQVRTLQTDVARQGRVAKDLERSTQLLRAQRDLATAKRDAMRRTLSWRVTGPLRVLGRLVGRLVPRRSGA